MPECSSSWLGNDRAWTLLYRSCAAYLRDHGDPQDSL